ALLPASWPSRAGGGDAVPQARLPRRAGRADPRPAEPRPRRGGDRPSAAGERPALAHLDRRGLFQAELRAGVLARGVSGELRCATASSHVTGHTSHVIRPPSRALATSDVRRGTCDV